MDLSKGRLKISRPSLFARCALDCFVVTFLAVTMNPFSYTEALAEVSIFIELIRDSSVFSIPQNDNVFTKITENSKKFSKNKQFFSQKILNIYVDVKNICEENTWKLRNYPNPLQTKGKDIMLSFIA